MKILNIKTTVAIAFLFFLLPGCSDFLDTKIDTNLTMEMIETNRDNLFQFGNAMYAPIQGMSGFTILDGNFFAAASDEAERTQESGYTYLFNKGTISPDNVYVATNYIYINCYEGIRAVNFFLDYAKNGEEIIAMNRDTIADVVQYKRDLKNLNWLRAEAHICRAYYYMELLKRFGGVPIVESTLNQVGSSSVNSGVGELVPRSSYDDVVEYIVKEIDDNVNNLQSSWRTNTADGNFNTFDGRFERKSALAIKSRVLLFAASPLNNPTDDVSKWERAARATQQVIDTLKIATMPSRSASVLSSYFQGVASITDMQSIFLIRDGVSNYLQRNNYPIATPGGNSGVTPTENLVSAYEYIGNPSATDPYANRDPRLAAWIATNGSRWNSRTIDQSPGGTDDMRNPNSSKTGYYLKKYIADNVNLVQGSTVANIWVVFRYPEILLNFAEAMNEAYGPDAKPEGFTMSARDALMQVRKSVSASLPAVTTTDVGEFRAAVKHECFVEFAFEDHRYWDLLRWKDAETILNTPVKGIMVLSRTGNNYEYQVNNNVGERVFYERNYRLPFARVEVTNSSNTLQQNDGYN